MIYLNGRFMPLEDAMVPVLDRGFIFGDGVYEVLPAYSRHPFRLVEHLRRLQNSLDAIGLKNPHTDTEWAKASGRGTLYSFGIMHQKFPGFAEDVPYNYAVVELEEGPRIVSNIVGIANEDLRVDMPLVACYDDVADDTTLVRFTPA